MSLSFDDLRECIASGQWRCTVEELQEAMVRVMARLDEWERAVSVLDSSVPARVMSLEETGDKIVVVGLAILDGHGLRTGRAINVELSAGLAERAASELKLGVSVTLRMAIEVP